jgi:outer membrane biosynthesis protein TonB
MLCSLAGASFAQSTDVSAPSPVRTNEVVGAIAARDLGDSRRTNHFYAFVGNPGDVLITIKSENLNGDVDLFTAGSLRPLLKFTLYAESSLPVTKSIYLRKRQDLVLRVEARSPNDDEGIYHIRLGGSFEPIAGESLLAAAENPAPDPSVATPPARGGNTRRVSSVGARIAEPPPPPEEVAAAATREPTPEPTPAETPAPSATPERTAETEAPAPSPRRTRGRAPAGRRRPPSRTTRSEETSATSETENKSKPAEAPDTAAATTPPGRRTGRRGATAGATESPQEPETHTGPRLIIEMQDGTRVERYMNTIRRVTVENNQIVVVNKLGRIERIRMSEVIRMSIEP